MIQDGKYGYFFHKWDDARDEFTKIRKGGFTVQNGQIAVVDGSAKEYIQVGPITDREKFMIMHSMQSSFFTVELEQ